jgi:hypothetical protein
MSRAEMTDLVAMVSTPASPPRLLELDRVARLVHHAHQVRGEHFRISRSR